MPTLIIKGTGRPRKDMYDALIKELRMKSLGSVRIHQELKDRGAVISRDTVARRLHKVDEELRTEGYEIIFR